MGMFDYVRSSYPLFSPEMDTRLQTKSLDCLMNQFWIDPAGRLWEIDYSETVDYEDHREPGDTPFQALMKMNVAVPNGRHGKVKPARFTGTVKVYPQEWTGPWDRWPERHLIFVCGEMTLASPGNAVLWREPSRVS